MNGHGPTFLAVDRPVSSCPGRQPFCAFTSVFTRTYYVWRWAMLRCAAASAFKQLTPCSPSSLGKTGAPPAPQLAHTFRDGTS